MLAGPACGIDVSELEVSLVPERGTCWGCLLNGAQRLPILAPDQLSAAECQICERCCDGILVPLARVRALSAEQAASLAGKRSDGFWNHAPSGMGGGMGDDAATSGNKSMSQVSQSPTHR